MAWFSRNSFYIFHIDKLTITFFYQEYHQGKIFK